MTARDEPIYAAKTTVPVAKSRGDLETLLRRAKATRILTMDEIDHALVMCTMGGPRLLRFKIPIKLDASDQVRRSKWRALYLVIRAKLESIAAGIETEEEAWLAHVVMPNGSTLNDWVRPAIEQAIASGKMPDTPLMLEGPKK